MAWIVGLAVTAGMQEQGPHQQDVAGIASQNHRLAILSWDTHSCLPFPLGIVPSVANSGLVRAGNDSQWAIFERDLIEVDSRGEHG